MTDSMLLWEDIGGFLPEDRSADALLSETVVAGSLLLGEYVKEFLISHGRLTNSMLPENKATCLLAIGKLGSFWPEEAKADTSLQEEEVSKHKLLNEEEHDTTSQI